MGSRGVGNDSRVIVLVDGAPVRKTHVTSFCDILYLNMPSFDQDRLRTNIGKALNKRDAFFRRSRCTCRQST